MYIYIYVQIYIYICIYTHTYMHIYIYIPQTSFSLWGFYLVLKELPKPFPPSKLPILHLFFSFVHKTNDIFRKVTFSQGYSYRSQGTPMDPKLFL